VESVDVFGTIAKWAGSAWDKLTSVTGAAGDAFQALWSYVASVLSGLSWVLLSIVSPGFLIGYVEQKTLLLIIRDTRDAVDRVAWWVWEYMITPVRADLRIQILVEQQERIAAIAELHNLVLVLHLVEQRYTDQEVAVERSQRVAAITSARAYSVALTTQLHQTIEAEAVAGYKAGQGIRTTLVQQLAQDLNVRGLLDAVTTEILVKAIDVIVSIDSPELSAVANKVISELVKKSGISGDIADLISRLITPGAGGADPKNLTAVIADLTHRIATLEDWISEFMLGGGAELEEEGKQLKTINSLVVDAALLAFFVQAVTSPSTWATEVNDTVGTVANDTIGRIISLISDV
jgi:hypothetical protein